MLSKSREIEFWFEFGSNYSYLSVMRIEDAAQNRGVRILWKPFLLGPIFRALGMENSPFVLQKEKGAYVWQDMARQCRKYGLQWRQPTSRATATTWAGEYNLCRIHESLRCTPAQAIGIADRVWSIADLLDAVLAIAPHGPVVTPPERRRQFKIIEGGKQ